MVTISSFLGCRNCFKSDGIGHAYFIKNVDLSEFQSKTEFEVMKQIEEFRNKDNEKCIFCGSTNVEVYDVEINDQPLYNYQKLITKSRLFNNFILFIKIDKKNGITTFQIENGINHSTSFLELAFRSIIDTIATRPDSHFLSKDKGDFFICISGIIDYSKKGLYIRNERLRSLGITRYEIISEIISYANKKNISI